MEYTNVRFLYFHESNYEEDNDALGYESTIRLIMESTSKRPYGGLSSKKKGLGTDLN